VLERKPLGELLLISPRRGELARAKVAVLPRCSTLVKPEIHPNRKPCIFIHRGHHTSTRNATQNQEQAKIDLEYKTLASLTWKELANDSYYQTVSIVAPEAA